MLLKETLIFALFITSIDIVWLKTVMGPMYRNWFSSIGISMPVHVLSAVAAHFFNDLCLPSVDSRCVQFLENQSCSRGNRRVTCVWNLWFYGVRCISKIRRVEGVIGNCGVSQSTPCARS